MVIKHALESDIYNTARKENNNGLGIPLNAWAMLHRECILNYNKIKYHSVINSISLDLAFNDFPQAIIDTLSIPDHITYSKDEGMILFSERLEKAICIIKKYMNDDIDSLSSFLKLIIPVKIKSGSKERLITSLTIPDLPFAAFFSTNSFIHLPPSIINRGFESYYFAENIVHEMTHNMLNINLLEKDILRESYSSNSSPSVDIPWRKGVEKRNRQWELDRILHAFMVYHVLTKFRKNLSKVKDSGITKEMAEEALVNKKFLQDSLLKNKYYFTSDGIKLIKNPEKYLY